MNELMIRESGQMAALFKMLEHVLDHIELLVENYRPVLGGEHHLTDREMVKLLRTYRRTLQKCRDARRMSYIQLGGKVLHRESGIERLLMEGYREVFRTEIREGYGKNVSGGRGRTRIEKWATLSGIYKKYL